MSEVYDRYVDTAGNYYYTDMETGHHVIPNTAVGSFPPPQTIKTNADHIRSMTDEELAEYLDGVCHDLWQMFVADPQKMWLDWLKEEVGE